MHHLFTRAAFAVAACLALATAALPAYALPALEGFWQITPFYDPNGVQAPSECFHFFQEKNTDGLIKGTWYSVTRKIWRGQYIQKGQHFEFHGYLTRSGESEANFGDGDFLTNNSAFLRSYAFWFQHGIGGGVSTPGSGTGTMTRVSECR